MVQRLPGDHHIPHGQQYRMMPMGAQADGPRASLEKQESLRTFKPEGDFDFRVGVDCHVFGLLAERLMP